MSLAVTSISNSDKSLSSISQALFSSIIKLDLFCAHRLSWYAATFSKKICQSGVNPSGILNKSEDLGGLRISFLRKMRNCLNFGFSFSRAPEGLGSDIELDLSLMSRSEDANDVTILTGIISIESGSSCVHSKSPMGIIKSVQGLPLDEQHIKRRLCTQRSKPSKVQPKHTRHSGSTMKASSLPLSCDICPMGFVQHDFCRRLSQALPEADTKGEKRRSQQRCREAAT